MRLRNSIFETAILLAAMCWLPSVCTLCNTICAQETIHSQTHGDSSATAASTLAPETRIFREQVQPMLREFCVRCHNAENMKSGIRLDELASDFPENQLFLWKDILKQISDEAMPPVDERQPDVAGRLAWVNSIRECLNYVKARGKPKNGSVRRLTVSQYRSTLRDLLGLEEDLSKVLPPDGVSKDGFTNNGQVLGLSPLQMEYYFEIASKALDQCIVDERSKPTIQSFRVDLGSGINPNPCPDKLILGADSLLLDNQDFTVVELAPSKPFEYLPFKMQTAFDFIEGYEGNDTVRGWKKFDSLYHAVFACMRGTRGYPKGQAYQVAPEGLLLRPAIPSSEIFGQASTYGPRANFKISLRELPEHGNFRVKVLASVRNDALLLDAGEAILDSSDSAFVTEADLTSGRETLVQLDRAGVYQLDVVYSLNLQSDSHTKGAKQAYEKRAKKEAELLNIELNGQSIIREVPAEKPGAVSPDERTSGARDRRLAFMLVRLESGTAKLNATYGDSMTLRRLALTRLRDDSELALRFAAFEKRTPYLGVHVGLRRDCGSTLKPVGPPQRVSDNQPREYVFEGAINNFPSPHVEADNVNYLAGIREIGVRSEFTDGRDIPRLLVRCVEFEGPLYSSWPPPAHRNIFIDSSHREDPKTYAREIIQAFTTRAYRRPATESELSLIERVWQASHADHGNFQRGIKEALTVVLTSPQFLFLIENSDSAKAENLDAYELASKLSYFLWNTSPDESLLKAAADNSLHGSLDAHIDRMINHQRFGEFVREFATQWLSLDKFDMVEIDERVHPRLTRDARSQLRQEPVEFLRYLFQHNLPVRNIVQSNFVLANDAVANYYDLDDRIESGIQFVPIRHQSVHRGGVLSQASILSGLSNGRESNPVKRGAWFARKIIAEPPDDPPPNVPELNERDEQKLTLRERLELHRNQEGCAKCHAGIDPWGLPFEIFDAAGNLKPTSVDARTTLPDGKQIEDLRELKEYLLTDRIDRIAFSFVKHLAVYAIGRSLSYNEQAYLEEETAKLKSNDYRLRDMIQFVVKSDIFLTK